MKFLDLLPDINENDVNISGVTTEMESLLIYKEFIKTNKSIIILTSSLYEASKIYNNLVNYSEDVLLFPMDNFITSEALSISSEFKFNRIEVINELIKEKKKIIVTHVMGYLRFLPSPINWKEKVIKIKKEQQLNKKEFINHLQNLGYKRDVLVNNTGEYAERGYIIDLFPINYDNPIRIELWGDVVESIKTFDEINQRSISELNSVSVSPINDSFDNNSDKNTISDYVDSNLIIYNDLNLIQKSYERIQAEVVDYISSQNTNKRQFMKNLEDIKITNFLNFTKTDDTTFNSKTLNIFSKSISDNTVFLEKLKKTTEEFISSGKTVVLCINSKSLFEKIKSSIDNIVIASEKFIHINKINLMSKTINKGFIYDNLVVISENDILGVNKQKKYKQKNYKLGNKIKDLNSLELGDYVVHEINGIGIYRGINSLKKNGVNKDFITIEYKDGDKVYIPASKIEYITKFSSKEGTKPKINKLGGIEWKKTKLKIQGKILNIAADLIKISAERQLKKGFAFNKDDENQLIFENDFPYQVTIDQSKAIENIKKDMEREIPMEHLLCGDVGFGKTEVAFRAIFKAVNDNKQVAYLCPTTILSNQIFKNSIDRFKNTGVNIEVLNRFISPKKARAILKALKDGQVDLLIGTHRLLSEDIDFKDLGLLVIDEEQRFGVTHKEKIKQIKNNVDVLMLSATPIPRTLQMSILGIRNLSIINTPPVNRYPVQTYILEENNAVVKDAIYKELSRGGQIFILYNNVQKIESKVNKLRKLIPDARIEYAHGQMGKKELENKMIDFINHEYDILVCTTIIEAGIDIPNVNTILILKANNFGLSQLYQIRGRVGRGNKIAYAYLMYTKGQVLSEIALKRLGAIKEFTALGSGYSIASRDLSIRGAGNIIGSAQSGFIDSVGITLYLKMLNEELAAIKDPNYTRPEIEISNTSIVDVNTQINDDFIPDDEIKIEIHQKINSINNEKELLFVKKELEDRFGTITNDLIVYMYEEWFEKLALKLKIFKVNDTKLSVEFSIPPNYSSKINGERLFMDLYDISSNFKISMVYNRLKIKLNKKDLKKHWLTYSCRALDMIIKNLKENKT